MEDSTLITRQTVYSCCLPYEEENCIIIKGAQTYVLSLFSDRDLEIILKVCLQSENEVARSECIVWIQKVRNYLPRSKSDVTNFQPVLAFTVGHIFLPSHINFSSVVWDFVQTDTQRQTDRQTPPIAIPFGSMHAANNTVSHCHEQSSATIVLDVFDIWVLCR